MRRWFGAALVTAAFMVVGGGVAAAAEGDPPPPTTPAPITLSPEQSAAVCNERIPALLGRIDRLETRIEADANTPGSTARLQQRLDQARAAGWTEQARRLEERLAYRSELSGRLDGARQRIEAFRDEKCG
jgi:hypothetical protein